MELVLSEGEKVYYNHDYCKGKSNITITDKRLISTVKSKKQLARHEIVVDDICTVTMRFNPVSVVSFVLGFISAILGAGIKIFELLMKNKDVIPNIEKLSIYFTIIMATMLTIAVINFIIGLLSLRNGYRVIIKAKASGYIGVLSISASMGKVKPLKLRPSKKDAITLMNDIPATIALIKCETSEQ